MKKLTVRDMALCALMAGLCAVCAWISIPMPDTPVTMQTFGVFLALFTLGGRRGSIAVLVYLCLGAVGLPVFAGFRGGIGALVGTTGGFLWGLLAGALVFRLTEKLWGKIPAAVAASGVCYACGCIWYMVSYASGGLWLVILRCVVPFIIPDAGKIALAWILSKRLGPL